MGARNPNPRRVKIHRSYTVAEAAECCRVHRNAVRRWVKAGLPIINDQKPALILGRELKAFLEARHAKRKQPCQAGEIYCVRCRLPRKPIAADYHPVTETSGNLTGRCPECGTSINRRVILARLDEIRGQMMVTMPQASLRIVKSA